MKLQKHFILENKCLRLFPDGVFDSLKVLRVISSVGDANQLSGRTITGQSSNATAIVESSTQFQIGDQTVTQLILNEDSIQAHLP